MAACRNNLSNCNKYLFEHVHTSILCILRLHWILDSWMVYDFLSFRRSTPLLEAWNGGLNTKNSLILNFSSATTTKLFSKQESYKISSARRNLMGWESTIENRNVQETKIKPEIIGRSAKSSINILAQTSLHLKKQKMRTVQRSYTSIFTQLYA